MNSLLDRMDALASEIEKPLVCTSPAYGAPGYAHCAACCYNTGYIITCDEDEALLGAVRAIRKATAMTRSRLKSDAEVL